MNFIWKKIRPLARGTWRIFGGFNGFKYDFSRFLKYGGWREDLTDGRLRNYKITMAYHGLEKSLSYKSRKSNSGWSNAERVLRKLQVASATGNIGYHDQAAIVVLKKFLELSENKDSPHAKEMMNIINNLNFSTSDESHGTIEYSIENYEKGILKNPEDFFLSRYSLREFLKKNVEEAVIERAVKMAMKTPSVCNRQAWHVYHTNNSEIIKNVLAYQNGNSGFGHQVPELFIITVDLRAFFVGKEHYQHWIDGGLFSMSLMYTLHSLGVASCALNWSQTPSVDKKLRSVIKIDPHHTIIMMMAAGYPDVTNKVCSSRRKPVNQIFSKIEMK